MTEKRLYTCDICHTDYADKNRATECEKSHCVIEGVHDTRYLQNQKYPCKIRIKFSDGITQWYRIG